VSPPLSVQVCGKTLKIAGPILRDGYMVHAMGRKNAGDKIKRDGTGSNQDTWLGGFTVPSHSLGSQQHPGTSSDGDLSFGPAASGINVPAKISSLQQSLRLSK